MITPLAAMAEGGFDRDGENEDEDGDPTAPGDRPARPSLIASSHRNPKDDPTSIYLYDPDTDVSETRRMEAQWVSTILENDGDYTGLAQTLIKCCAISFESMDTFLSKHEALMDRHFFSMEWDVQREVCDKLRQSKQLAKTKQLDAIESDSDNDSAPSAAPNSKALAPGAADTFSNLDWLDRVVHSHLNHQSNINNLPDRELVSIFFLNNNNLKIALSPGPLRCLNHLKSSLPPFFCQYANSILDQLSLANRDMSSVCSTVHEYVEQLDSVKSVEELYENVDREVSRNPDRFLQRLPRPLTPLAGCQGEPLLRVPQVLQLHILARASIWVRVQLRPPDWQPRAFRDWHPERGLLQGGVAGSGREPGDGAR
jgi:hypothetical protein